MSHVEIRLLETLDDYRRCVALQEEVWGEGFSERAPVSLLKVSQRLGGVVAGAFDADGRMVGFVFGVTGLEEGRAVHWSDMLAVLPDVRDRGLGSRLKSFQRARCLELGVDRMYWTFDPLESRNAYLNMAKLGAVSREYVENMYGHSDSPLHRGLGSTDRFVALWRLDTRRVEDRVSGRSAPAGYEDVIDLPVAFEVTVEDGMPRPGEVRDRVLGEAAFLVPIPARIQAVKDRDPAVAGRWREVTRAVFARALDGEAEVRELIRRDATVSCYLVERRPDVDPVARGDA